MVSFGERQSLVPCIMGIMGSVKNRFENGWSVGIRNV